MLVSAFAGYEHVMKAYQHAVKEKYRFFSYGDAMFIEKRTGESESCCSQTVRLFLWHFGGVVKLKFELKKKTGMPVAGKFSLSGDCSDPCVYACWHIWYSQRHDA